MLDDLLIHECRVFRRSGDLDRFGQPARDNEEWISFPCRVTNPSGGEQMGERTHDVVIVNHTVILPVDADVREDDEVTVVGNDDEEIVPRGQVTLKKQPYDGVGPHHIEILVTCQRQTR